MSYRLPRRRTIDRVAEHQDSRCFRCGAAFSRFGLLKPVFVVAVVGKGHRLKNLLLCWRCTVKA